MIARIRNRIQGVLIQQGIISPSLYTDQDQIIGELSRRQALFVDDSELVKAIRPTPSIQHLLDRPHLVFGRHIATPLHETLRVIEIAHELNLDLCIFEFQADTMVSAHNQYKHGLARLPIFDAIDKNGNDIFHRSSIVDLNISTGHSLAEVHTIKNESLVDFHHELFTYITGINVSEVATDFSDWLAKYHSHAAEYYEAFLTLFVKHNVLAEIFYDEAHDKEQFTKKIVIPAFLKVTKKHGYQPLIINYQPPDEQNRLFWDGYPARANDFLRIKGYID